jgi:hypothetical protein
MRLNHFLPLILLAAGLVQGQTSPGGYRVAVIDGEGALNNISRKISREPVVQVSDASHKPVSGAYVEFDAPGNGAGATFANGSTHFATTTNADGLAVGSHLTNNGTAGSFVLNVHVSYQGQSIGEAQIPQTNVTGAVSKHLQQGSTTGTTSGEVPGNVTLSNNVLGIALGDEFLVNGASTPSNANLLKGTRIQALDKPTTLYLHDRCEYVVGPHSLVTIGIKLVMLESGSVRARRFGDCRVMYNGMSITGAPNTDGVVSLSGQNLEVAAINGNMQIVNGAGDVVNTVNAGTVSTLGTSSEASGATVGGTTGPAGTTGATGAAPAGIPFKTALRLGTTIGVALAGLGLATDAILQPTGSGTPTSP